MSDALFAGDVGVRRIPMHDADVVLHPSVDLGVACEEALARLHREIAWREETITLFGKTMLQPRLVAWHGDPGATYVYSKRRFEPQPWTELLLELRRRVEAAAGASFNSVLLNLYRDHRDSVAMHADDEPELGPEPVIASLSLGATRTLDFRHKSDRSAKTWRVPLEAGSLLVMRGPTQRCWLHGVAKLAKPTGLRINLTFRRIVG